MDVLNGMQRQKLKQFNQLDIQQKKLVIIMVKHLCMLQLLIWHKILWGQIISHYQQPGVNLVQEHRYYEILYLVYYCFILFILVLSHTISCYFILFYFILFYFILFYMTSIIYTEMTPIFYIDMSPISRVNLSSVILFCKISII